MKAWGYLRRQGVSVGRCAVERLMRANSWRGNSRGLRRKPVTTTPDPANPRHPDLVGRDFRARRPGQLLVGCLRRPGRRRVRLHGIRLRRVRRDDPWLGVLPVQGHQLGPAGDRPGHGRAAPLGRRPDQLAGRASFGCQLAQYTSLKLTETLALAGIAPSIGTVGDNALAETLIGLYKWEAIRDGSPFRDGPIATLGDLEKITAAWASWYNNERLVRRLGLRPPAEADAAYWASQEG